MSLQVLFVDKDTGDMEECTVSGCTLLETKLDAPVSAGAAVNNKGTNIHFCLS